MVTYREVKEEQQQFEIGVQNKIHQKRSKLLTVEVLIIPRSGRP